MDAPIRFNWEAINVLCDVIGKYKNYDYYEVVVKFRGDHMLMTMVGMPATRWKFKMKQALPNIPKLPMEKNDGKTRT